MKIAKIIDSTFSHTTNIISKFNEYGIVEFHQNGRKKEVVLTGYGLRIAHILKEFIQVMEIEQKSSDGGDVDIKVDDGADDNIDEAYLEP